MKVSIIIPTKTIDAYAKRCIEACESLWWSGPVEDMIGERGNKAYEIMVITDEICPGLPAAKRNYAMQKAKGDIYAFIDSDAYPSKDWLSNALFWLRSFQAVCGPGVLPPDAPEREHLADQVHKWVFCPYRVAASSPKIVPWYPTFNLIVKKEVATQFDPYLTGEDDRFGLKIPGGIFYHPSILVYHNRRGAFRPLWRQFSTWGRHKGAFVGMACVAWLTTVWTYAVNWVKGFICRKP